MMLPDGKTHMLESDVEFIAMISGATLWRVSQSIVSNSYVSPIACRCCPMSLMMSLSVRDISLTAGLGSAGAG